MKKTKHKPDTIAAHSGRDPASNHGIVNPPVYHASTVLFPNTAELDAAHEHRFEPDKVYYGRMGTPTTFAFEEAVCELESGFGAVVAPSGLSAISTALLAFAHAGDHMLIADTVYYPNRAFCRRALSRLGVEVEFYDPLIGAEIETLIRDNTRLVFVESPGSLTFEIQDLPAIARVARAAGIATVFDNTWASPLFHQPLALGADVVIHAATKYLVGHSDAMLGVIVCSEPHYRTIQEGAIVLGVCAGPDDIYLGLRGIRSLPTRMREHERKALEVARWLQQRPEVSRVLHPALEEHPGHALWKRDFTGSSGLFSVVLNDYSKRAVAAMLDGMELFGLGFSWGGFESLIVPAHPEKIRTATPWQAEGPVLRLHIGLEDTGDLIEDLEHGFERLNKHHVPPA